MINKAVIPAAGLGTRLYPLSSIIPKELLPIGEKPAIEYVLEEAILAGIKKFAIIINKNKEIIKQYFFKVPHPQLDIEFFYQDPIQGLGDAISYVKDWTNNEPFAILLPDNIFDSEVPAIKQLIENYKKYEENIVGLIEVASEQEVIGASFSKIETEPLEDKIYKITHIYDKNYYSEDKKFNLKGALRGIGRYVLKPEIFPAIETVRLKVQGELDDIQPLRLLVQQRKLLGALLKGKRFDVGNWNGYKRAFKYFVEKV